MINTLLFKSTFRLIRKNKVLSAIKIIGLSSGTAIFLLTTLFCLSELDYDKQHLDYGRIHRFVHQVNTPEGLQRFAYASATIGPALQERYPEVEGYARFVRADVISIRNTASDASFNERKFAFADPTFLNYFHFPLRGDPGSGNQKLTNPLSIILTPIAAKKYFGNENPIGKTLLINGELLFTVTGVFLDDPSKTHFDFDFLASFNSLEVIGNHPMVSAQIPVSLALETKGYAAFYTYLLLSPGTNPEDLIAKFPAFIEDFRGKGKSERLKPTLQSLSSIHLSPSLLAEIKQNGSARVVYIYFFIGVLVLSIACINYINISTAEFLNRFKGIGLKKILGVTRTSLLWTHLGETSILCLFSLLLGCAIAWLMLPTFNTMVNRNLAFFTYETGLIALIVFTLIVLMSGIYPAMQITKAPTLLAFKGSMNVKSRVLSLRNILVFFQLAISFGLLAMSLLINHQLDYLLNKSLGFDSDKIMVINATTASPAQRSALKKELAADKNIREVTMCSTPPSESHTSFGLILPENSGDDERRILFYHSYVDADYANAMGLNLTEGRFFSLSNPGDSVRYVVINAAGTIALGDSVMNRSLDIPKFFTAGNNRKIILGMFEDYHFESLHSQVQPLILEYNPDRCGYLLARFESSTMNSVVEAAGQAWKEMAPLLPFDYYFMEDNFAKFYDNEHRQKKVISGVAIIAIVLASLGIFGSTLFLIERRTKEVAVRKIIGSSRFELLSLLFRPMLILVIVSCAIALPVVFVSGNNWLQQYPYRTDFSPFLLVISFLIILMVVTATTLYHFLKVTRVNPAKILKQVN